MEEKSIYQGRKAISKFTPDEVAAFMKIIKFEFYSFFGLNNPKNIKNTNNLSYSSYSFSFMGEEQNSKLYFSKYTRYLLYEFDSTKVNMIILFINKSISFPQIYKNEQDFTKNMIELLKHLMMNEIEIAYFTLLIDLLGWEHEKIEHWIYFSILGILSKKFCLKDDDSNFILLINIFSRKYPSFLEIYSNFIENQKIKEKTITINSINKRFIQLTKPINTYCRENFININGIIDKIVKSSHPYLKSEFQKDSYEKEKTSKTTNSELKTQFDNLFFILNNDKSDINFENLENNEYEFLNNLNIDDCNDFFKYAGNLGYLNFFADYN